MPTAITTLRLDTEMHAQLKAIAAAEERTLAQTVRSRPWPQHLRPRTGHNRLAGAPGPAIVLRACGPQRVALDGGRQGRPLPKGERPMPRNVAKLAGSEPVASQAQARDAAQHDVDRAIDHG